MLIGLRVVIFSKIAENHLPFLFVGNKHAKLAILTESIQDTSPRIHPSRNKKPVSDETCPPILSVRSMLQSKISNLKSKID